MNHRLSYIRLNRRPKNCLESRRSPTESAMANNDPKDVWDPGYGEKSAAMRLRPASGTRGHSRPSTALAIGARPVHPVRVSLPTAESIDGGRLTAQIARPGQA